MITKLRKRSTLMLEYAGRMPRMPPASGDHALAMALYLWHRRVVDDARALARAAEYLENERLARWPR